MILRKKEQKQWRIYDHERQQYIYGATLIGSDGKVYTQEFHPKHKIVVYENTTIEQNTFVKDKNGRFIYEGDIVRHMGGGGYMRVSQVKFNRGCYNVGTHSGSSTANKPMLLNSRITILGNIHQTPELLKEKNAD